MINAFLFALLYFGPPPSPPENPLFNTDEFLNQMLTSAERIVNQKQPSSVYYFVNPGLEWHFFDGKHKGSLGLSYGTYRHGIQSGDNLIIIEGGPRLFLMLYHRDKLLQKMPWEYGNQFSFLEQAGDAFFCGFFTSSNSFRIVKVNYQGMEAAQAEFTIEKTMPFYTNNLMFAVGVNKSLVVWVPSSSELYELSLNDLSLENLVHVENLPDEIKTFDLHCASNLSIEKKKLAKIAESEGLDKVDPSGLIAHCETNAGCAIRSVSTGVIYRDGSYLVLYDQKVLKGYREDLKIKPDLKLAINTTNMNDVVISTENIVVAVAGKNAGRIMRFHTSNSLGLLNEQLLFRIWDQSAKKFFYEVMD